MSAIIIKNLTKKYGTTTAVDNLSLEIKEGELFSLLGINGAGKSTTIKMLCALTTPTSGDATLLGYSILTSDSEIKKFIAVSPQETAIATNLTVKENLVLICKIHGYSAIKTQNKVEEMLKTFSLESVKDKKSNNLSGGYKRRLSIAMALISEPKILFLDEPTLGLDVISRSELWDTIKALKGKVTILLTTHYMEEAEELSNRVGIMKDGKMLSVGKVQELKELTKEDKFENAFIKIVKGENV